MGVSTTLAAAIAYFVARRQHSGRIETTEAATLWAASEAMRHDLMARNTALEKKVDELLARVRELEQKV
jgi:hypothetical protein